MYHELHRYNRDDIKYSFSISYLIVLHGCHAVEYNVQNRIAYKYGSSVVHTVDSDISNFLAQKLIIHA